MSTAAMTARLLNSWDYVFAVELAAVNRALAAAQAPRDAASGLRTPRTCTLELPGLDARRLELVFGCPSLAATGDALKSLAVTLPLKGTALVHGERRITLPADTQLVVTASLAAGDLLVQQAAPNAPAAAPGSRRYDVHLSMPSAAASLAVQLEDAAHQALNPELAEAMRAQLGDLFGASLVIASFELPDRAEPLLPRCIEAAVVRAAGKPGRDVLALAASLDPQGARDDARLDFQPALLPVDVPAALWVGPGVVLEKLLMPLLADGLRNGESGPPLVFDEERGQIVLNDRIEIPQPRDRLPIVLDGLRVFAAAGATELTVQFHTHADLHTLDAFSRGNTGATHEGHIALQLSADRHCLVLSYKAGKPVAEEPMLSQPDKWGYGAAYYAALQWMINRAAEHLNGRATALVTALNALLQGAPANARQPAEPTVYERAAFAEGAAVFLGIRTLGSG